MVSKRQLQKPPLIEALVEVKWELQSSASGLEIDPHYKLILARLADRLLSKYPEHEPLPTSLMPEHVLAHTIQHRFRISEEAWPLVQVGPGILTFNETDKYAWEDFEGNVEEVLAKLFEVHPQPDELKITSLALRFINAIEFDFTRESILGFLNQQLRSNISFPPELFRDSAVGSSPIRLDCNATFPSQNPKGAILIRFAAGHIDKSPALIWELVFQTQQDDLPGLPQGFSAWMTAAHQVIEEWFSKLIAGDLERRFSPHG